MKRIAGFALLFGLLLVPGALHAADDLEAETGEALEQDASEDAELKRLEGRFERRVPNAAGVMFTVIRQVIGDQSTVVTYDDVGNIIEAHTSTIRTEKQGPVRVLSFFNLVVTAGPNKGFTQAAPSSYVYQVDDDSFTEVWGLLENDSVPPRLISWRRIDEEE